MRKNTEQFAAQAHIFFTQRHLLQRPVDGEFQFLNKLIALDDILIGAQVERVDGRFHGGMRRNQNKSGGVPAFAEKLEQLNAREVRHADVGNDQIVNLGLEL